MSEEKPPGRLRFGLRAAARAVRDPKIGIRFAVIFLLRDVIWESLPTWLRRYWFLALIGLGLCLLESLILLYVLARPDFLSTLREWDLRGRLDFGQFAIEALALALAIAGALVVIGQIRSALEKPRLLLTFQGLSTYEHVDLRQALPGLDCESQKNLRIWNLSDVMAEHIRVRLLFEDLGPLRLEITDVHAGNWMPRQDLPGIQWVFDPGPTFMLHGGEVEVIGFIRISLPAIVDFSTLVAVPNMVSIRAFLLDAAGRREQTLRLMFRPWRGPSPTAIEWQGGRKG